jgi:hypothetical protein
LPKPEKRARGRPVGSSDQGEKRQEFVTAVMKAIAEHGYKDVTVATICQAAGFSRGLIGHYFTGKDAWQKWPRISSGPRERPQGLPVPIPWTGCTPSSKQASAVTSHSRRRLEGGVGAPRPMKMGTTRSLWRYDWAAFCALRAATLRTRPIMHYALRTCCPHRRSGDPTPL